MVSYHDRCLYKMNFPMACIHKSSTIFLLIMPFIIVWRKIWNQNTICKSKQPQTSLKTNHSLHNTNCIKMTRIHS